MLFWILVALMTAVVAIVLLKPLLGARAAPVVEGRHDAAVYRDQLDEIGRDLTQGLISRDEAELARAEVARRLLSADAQAGTQAKEAGPSANRLAQALIILLLPAVGLCLYLTTGSPGCPMRRLPRGWRTRLTISPFSSRVPSNGWPTIRRMAAVSMCWRPSITAAAGWTMRRTPFPRRSACLAPHPSGSAGSPKAGSPRRADG